MSKLYDLMEAYKAVSEMCEYRKVAENTMNEALKALKYDPKSEELLKFYYNAKLDYERIDLIYKEVKREYEELYKKYKKNSDFLEQLKYTTDVPEEYRHILAALRSDLGIAVGFEPGQE